MTARSALAKNARLARSCNERFARIVRLFETVQDFGADDIGGAELRLGRPSSHDLKRRLDRAYALHHAGRGFDRHGLKPMHRTHPRRK